MNFRVMLNSNKDEYAWLEIQEPAELSGICSKIFRGASVAHLYPEGDVIWNLDKKVSGKRIAAFIPNLHDFKVINTKLKEVLENESGAKFEFYPHKIRDHRGRILPEQFWIANLLTIIPCMNEQRSCFEWDALAKGQVDYFMRLVLDESKIPKGTKLFRLGEKTEDWYIDESFVEILLDTYDLRGAAYRNLRDYGENYRDPDEYIADPELGY